MIENILYRHALFFFSDDEGSDEEDEEEGEGDEDENEEEYDEDDNDEDYEDEEGEEEEEDVESPSFFFGKTSTQPQQNPWNSFQFATPKTNSAQPESVSGLSSLLAGLNPCSPFSFGLQPNTQVTPVFFLSQKRNSFFI